MRKLAILSAAIGALALPAGASANHVPGATYSGTVTTGDPGGTVEMTVSEDGTTVNFSATNFGQSGCGDSTFGVDDIPITNHSFAFNGSDPTRHISGSFPSPGTASGSVRLSFACESGFQSWTAEAPVGAADAAINRLGDNADIGYGVFNTTGAGQTRTWSARRGQARTFGVTVVNSGSEPTRIDIKGCGSSADFRVRYESISGANITSRVLAGTFGQNRNSGATVYAAMIIKPKASARIGQTKVCRASGLSDVNRDVVKAELTVRRG